MTDATERKRALCRGVADALADELSDSSLCYALLLYEDREQGVVHFQCRGPRAMFDQLAELVDEIRTNPGQPRD
jgi:hypothetical protein